MFTVSSTKINMMGDLPPKLVEKFDEFDEKTKEWAIRRYCDLVKYTMDAYVLGHGGAQCGSRSGTSCRVYPIVNKVFEELANEQGWNVKMDAYASEYHYEDRLQILPRDNCKNTPILTRYQFPSANSDMPNEDKFQTLCELTRAPLELVDLYQDDSKITAIELMGINPKDPNIKLTWRNRKRMAAFSAYLDLMNMIWRYRAGLEVSHITIGPSFDRFKDAIEIFHQKNQRCPFRFTFTPEGDDKLRVDMTVTTVVTV